MLNVLIFGFGRAGKIHYENCKNSEFYNVKYVVDIIDNNEINFLNYNDKEKLEQVMENEIDAIIVASPTDTHYEVIKLGLKFNKHIFVEKPIVKECFQISECFNLAEEKNVILFVGYNRRYDPKIMEIKDKIENNDIGKVNYALTISRDYPYPSESFIKISAGIFNDCATHDIDYLNWILDDKPETVSVCVDNHNNHEGYNFDHVLINLKYFNGTIASVNLSRISSSYDQRCEFYGENGEIINNEFLQHAKLSFPERYKQAFINELDSFYDCIVNNRKPKVKKEECLNNQIIASACEDSFNQNKKIKIKY